MASYYDNINISFAEIIMWRPLIKFHFETELR